MIAFASFDGVSPSDPAGAVRIHTFVRIVLDTGANPDTGEGFIPLVAVATVPMDVTAADASAAVLAEVIAEADRNGHTLTPGDVLFTNTYGRG